MPAVSDKNRDARLTASGDHSIRTGAEQDPPHLGVGNSAGPASSDPRPVLLDRLGYLRVGRLVTTGHDLRLRGHSSHRNAEDGAAAGATPG
jgi:hypothetical protein